MSIGFFLHGASVRGIRLYEKGDIVRLSHNTFTHLLVDSCGRMNLDKSRIYIILFSKLVKLEFFQFYQIILISNEN